MNEPKVQNYKSNGIFPIHPTTHLIAHSWDISEFFGLIARSIHLLYTDCILSI